MPFAQHFLFTPVWFWTDTPEIRISKLWWRRLLSRREAGAEAPTPSKSASSRKSK